MPGFQTLTEKSVMVLMSFLPVVFQGWLSSSKNLQTSGLNRFRPAKVGQ